jgi:hypothetical protein
VSSPARVIVEILVGKGADSTSQSQSIEALEAGFYFCDNRIWELLIVGVVKGLSPPQLNDRFLVESKPILENDSLM